MSNHRVCWSSCHVIVINSTWSTTDPPENCHLNVKKLPKTRHFLKLKKYNFCQFFWKKCRFWQFFDSQMAIFQRFSSLSAAQIYSVVCQNYPQPCMQTGCTVVLPFFLYKPYLKFVPSKLVKNFINHPRSSFGNLFSFIFWIWSSNVYIYFFSHKWISWYLSI